MTPNPTPTLDCPLCHFLFTRTETPCGRGCPLGRLCKLICCPNCGFEFPDNSGRFSWLQRWFHRSRPGRSTCEIISLCDIEEGAEAEVACLVCAHESRRNTLAVYGLVPGGRIILQQKRPSYVVRVGETELALETAIAREIFVKSPPRPAADTDPLRPIPQGSFGVR